MNITITNTVQSRHLARQNLNWDFYSFFFRLSKQNEHKDLEVELHVENPAYMLRVELWCWKGICLLFWREKPPRKVCFTPNWFCWINPNKLKIRHRQNNSLSARHMTSRTQQTYLLFVHVHRCVFDG